jgi:4'-phosphopantetheinyl transferase
MTSVFYYNISGMKDYEMGLYINIVPVFMRADIMRYKYAADRKARLIARLMLYHCMAKDGATSLIYDWGKDNNNKPFIAKWKPFNISHSGEMVMFSYANNVTGIDIEEKCDVKYEEMIEYFHPAEQEFIRKQGDIQENFYKVWVRKEALLKAIGTGITNGLKQFNCLRENVSYAGKHWYFHPLPVHPWYTSYLCSPEKEEKIIIKKFLVEKILTEV